MKKYTKSDMVKKIFGEISSVGSSHVDEERFENLEEFAFVINEYVGFLLTEAKKINRPQASMQKSGKLALEIIEDIYYDFKNFLEDNNFKEEVESDNGTICEETLKNTTG